MPWRVGRKLGRTLYLDDRCIGMLDDPELARAVVDGLVLLDELGDGDEGEGGEGAERWRVRLVVWRLRVRALRLAALRRQRTRRLRPARGRGVRASLKR